MAIESEKAAPKGVAFFMAVAANETASPYNFVTNKGRRGRNVQLRTAVLEIYESRPHLKSADKRR